MPEDVTKAKWKWAQKRLDTFMDSGAAATY